MCLSYARWREAINMYDPESPHTRRLAMREFTQDLRAMCWPSPPPPYTHAMLHLLGENHQRCILSSLSSETTRVRVFDYADTRNAGWRWSIMSKTELWPVNHLELQWIEHFVQVCYNEAMLLRSCLVCASSFESCVAISCIYASSFSASSDVSHWLTASLLNCRSVWDRESEICASRTGAGLKG